MQLNFVDVTNAVTTAPNQPSQDWRQVICWFIFVVVFTRFRAVADSRGGGDGGGRPPSYWLIFCFKKPLISV